MSHWLSITPAVRLIAERLTLSIGAAGAALCEACASGVRWRDEEDDYRFIVPIRTSPGVLGGGVGGGLTKAVWSKAHIDRGVIFADRRKYDRVIISRDDLLFWLSKRESRTAPAAAAGQSQSAHSTKHGGRAPAPFWEDAKREAFKWLDENGSPRPRTGDQARLEDHIAGFLAKQDEHPAESSIRDYVVRSIVDFKATGRG